MGLALTLAVLLASGRFQLTLRGQEKEGERIPGRIVRIKLPSPGTVKGMLLGPEVTADKDGSIRLAHSVLLADETGATDFRQTETLSDRVWAKKVFSLDDRNVEGAELFFFGTAGQVRMNGQPLKGEPLISTGWTRARIPPGCLKRGENEVVFAGGGSLLIEPGRPGRSSKSADGGDTWSNRELGDRGHLQGEYLVRLRLSRYAARGWTMTPVFDLWSAPPTEVARPWKIERFDAVDDLARDQPEGTRLMAWLRTGSTPLPDGRNWTDWRKLDRDQKTDRTTAGHRWAQVKYDLVTTRAQATPRLRLPWVGFLGAPRDDPSRKGKFLKIIPPADDRQEQEIAVSSVPFVYQQPSPRLQLLREKYQLDKVIAHGKTEMEQLMLLRSWVRNQCHRGWASHPALWIPPWDALLILESRDRPDCLVMCTHYACIFTQCCLALGWNARHCILDHHCVSEVWVDQHRKWVMMDTGNSAERADVGLHFERGGVPLSARELQLLHRSGKADGVQVCFTPARLIEKIAALCRPAPPPKAGPQQRPDVIPLADLKKYPVCQLDNFRRYAFPPRNNFLTTLYPGELEQGFSHYFYDGYCWVGDSPDDPRISPEYSRHLPPERAQDVDWGLNRVRIHLCQTERPGELQVDIEDQTPNLARLETRTNGGWRRSEARFVWKLEPGVNVLEARGVNHWDRAGCPSRVRVEWKPAARDGR
jgi:hypothetical protein